MSLFTYNGVTLPYPLTTSFNQDGVYDDSNTDRIYTKFNIGIQCLLNASYLSDLASDLFLPFPNNNTPATKNPADIMDVIRSRLLKPRQSLSMKFNGVELIPQPQPGNKGTVDAKNGPQPKSCSITPVSNTTFLMNYSIEAHYWENNKIVLQPGDNKSIVQNQAGANVLYNRWSEVVDIDNCNYSTRTRDGKYIIRSDATIGQIADESREQMAVVGVPPGFLRKSSKYTVSPDGLGVSYNVVDQEIFKKPPTPAFEATGYYTESTTRGGGNRFGEVSIHLKGSKTTSQGALIDTAIKVAARKLGLRGQELDPGKGFQILEMGSVKMGLYENTVEVTLRGLIAPSADRIGPVGFFKDAIDAFVGMGTYTPVSSRTYVPKYLSRGTANLVLQAAAYYDPSLRGVFVEGDGDNCSNQLNAGLQVGEAGKEKEK